MKYLSGYTDPFISPVSGKIPLPYKHVLLGDEGNASYFSKTILQDNLPDLQKSHIRVGIPQLNSEGVFISRPTPFDLSSTLGTAPYPSLIKTQIANPDVPDDQQYVSFSQAEVNQDYAWGQEPFVVLGQRGDKSLPQAQALNTLYNIALTPNILKLSLQPPDPLDPEKLPFAKIEIATPGFDFLTLAQLEEAEIVIVENTVVAVANKLMGAVTGKIVDVIPDPEHPDIKIKKIETTFQENAKFPGNVSITIPIGGDNSRPQPTPETPVTGMFRYNSDTHYFEGGNDDGWRKMYGAGKPTYITDTFGISDNLYIGTDAGKFADNGSARNVVIGINTLSSGTLANPVENVAVGYNALSHCGNIFGNAASFNVAIGFASQEWASGKYNVSIGHQALQYCGFVENAIAIGRNALSRAGTGTGIWSALDPGGNHVAIGQSTLENMYRGEHNIAIGACALQYPTNVNLSGIPLEGYIDGSIAIGYCALQGNPLEQFQTVTDGSIAIGAYAGANYAPFTAKPLGNPNIFIGYSAARLTRSGSSNLALGYRSLFYLNSDSINPLTAESRHIAIGDRSSLNFTTSHAWLAQHPNLAIGVDALGQNNTGRGNVAVGDSALVKITGNTLSAGGDFNTAIGYKSGVSGENASGLTNAIAIGAFATARRSNTLVLGGKDTSNNVYFPHVSIGHQDPEYSLHIKGTGENDLAIFAIKQTPATPNDWVGGENHVFFYGYDGDAYVRSRNLDRKKIGVKSTGTDRQITVQNDPNDSTQQKISIAENPVLPGHTTITGKATIQQGADITGNTSIEGHATIKGKATVTDDFEMTGTGALTLPSGTASERPATLKAGMLRFRKTS